jgi:hypothetical protein
VRLHADWINARAARTTRGRDGAAPSDRLACEQIAAGKITEFTKRPVNCASRAHTQKWVEHPQYPYFTANSA